MNDPKPDRTDEVTTPPQRRPNAADASILAQSRRHTRRSFVVAAAGAAAGFGFYDWLNLGPHENMQPVALEHAYDFNAGIARHNLLEHALAPTYPLKRAETLRVNGVVGLKKVLVPESYRLQLVGMAKPQAHPSFTDDVTAWQYRYTEGESTGYVGHDTKTPPPPPGSAPIAPSQTDRKPRGLGEAGESFSTLKPQTPGLLLTIEDITRLPRHELVTQFKCIEGWSQVVHWAGVRMADFLDAYPPARIDGKEPRFVYMETPDGDYYVGYDMSVCRHPQTLLVTEMMGAPLSQYHGAPLRMHMPTKYGYKQIKRIGLIAYTNEKPDDYWTELGYDWYAGL